MGNGVPLHDGEFVAVTHGDEVFNEAAVVGHLGVHLGDHALGFLDGGEILDLVGHLAVDHLAVGGLQETVLVGARVAGQRVDQADVRAFRRLDRTYPAVVGRVHVAHFEAGALTGQAARAQRGDTTLVRDLGQRVVLVHELGQLGGAEELLHRRRHRLGVDQVLGHQALGLGQAQALFHGALDTDQTDAELVLGHLADGTDAAVAQVIDVIGHAVAVADVHQRLQYVDDVGGLAADLLVVLLAFIVGAVTEVATVIDDTRAGDVLTAQTAVELHPAHAGQVVALVGEEQVAEQVLRRFLGGRLAGAHHAIDFHQRLKGAAGGIGTQGVGHERPVVEIVGVQRLEPLDAALLQFLERVGAQLGITLQQYLAGFLVDDGLGEVTALEVFGGNFQVFDIGFFELADVTRGYPAATFHHHFIAGQDIERRGFTTQTFRHQAHAIHTVFDQNLVGLEEDVENFIGGVTQGAQQDRRRQLAAAVDTHIHHVLGIELEVQPGTTVRNHPG